MAFRQDTFQSAVAQQEQSGIDIDSIIGFMDTLKKQKKADQKVKKELFESEINARKAGLSILDDQGNLADAPRRLSQEEIFGDLNRLAESSGLDLSKLVADVPGGTATFGGGGDQAAATLEGLQELIGAGGPGGRVSKASVKLPGAVTATVDFPETQAQQATARETEALDIQSKERAKQEVATLTPGAATTVGSAESAIGAIDELLTLEAANPGTIKLGQLPATPPFGGENVQTADLLLKRLTTEITTARGGKQLTKTEIKFIAQLTPKLLRLGKVNVKGLQDLRELLDKVRVRILGEARVEREAANVEAASSTQAVADRLTAKFGGGGG